MSYFALDILGCDTVNTKLIFKDNTQNKVLEFQLLKRRPTLIHFTWSWSMLNARIGLEAAWSVFGVFKIGLPPDSPILRHKLGAVLTILDGHEL